MNRSLFACLLATTIAVPAAFATTSQPAAHLDRPMRTDGYSLMESASGTSLSMKPGARKHKKKMSKQMKKRKRH